MKNREILITTTSVIEGLKLENYKGIVSSRVVTGTDYFSDLIASFSDVFGGRSGIYQNQLKSIYDEVLDLLTEEAKKVGANAIIGVNIDHDEISGKGKQMFMVTATGTAAKVPDYQVAEIGDLEEVTSEKFEYEYVRLKTINTLKNDFEQVGYKWEFLTTNSLPEVMEEVLKYYMVNIEYEHANLHKNTMNYYAIIEEQIAKDFFYNKLATVNDAHKLIRLIKDIKLIDYSQIEERFRSGNDQIKKVCISIVSGNKSKYYSSDFGKLESLINTISTTYTSKNNNVESDKWTCECGKINKINQVYCKSCDKDVQGFKKEDANLDETIKILKEKLYVLKHIFKIS